MREIIQEVTAGGHHAIDLGLLEAEYFAAVAVHAGVLVDPGAILRMADRKLLNEMPRHTDDYYGSAAQVNKEAWEMLKAVRLPANPKFKSYAIR